MGIILADGSCTRLNAIRKFTNKTAFIYFYKQHPRWSWCATCEARVEFEQYGPQVSVIEGHF